MSDYTKYILKQAARGTPGVLPSHERSTLGKLLHALGTGERLGIKYLVEPALKAVSPGVAGRLEALRKERGDIYGMDVAEAIWPIEEEKAWYSPEKLARGALGFGIGAAVDPLSYIAPGATKLGKLAAIKAGTLAGARRGIPKHLEGALRMLPGYEQALARAGGTPSEVAASVMRAGIRGPSKIELRAMRNYWDLVPDLPHGFTDKLKAGMWSFLRLDIPFTKYSEDASSLLRKMQAGGLADAIDYSEGWLVERLGVSAKKLFAGNVVGRSAHRLAMLWEGAFGVGIVSRPEVISVVNRVQEVVNASGPRAARKVAEEFLSQQEDLVQLVASTMEHLPIEEVRKKLFAVVRDSVELFQGDKKLAVKAYRMQGWEQVSKKGRLKGRAELVPETRSVDEILSETFQDQRLTDPAMGGPLHILDDNVAAATRAQVVNVHDLYRRQRFEELQRGFKTPALYGAGAYSPHRFTEEVREILAKEAPQVLKGHAGARAGFQIMRKWRTLVPEEVIRLESKLSDLGFTKRELVAMKSGDLKGKLRKSVDKKLLKAVRSGEKGLEGLSVDEIQSLVYNFTTSEVNAHVKKFGWMQGGKYIIEPGSATKLFNEDLTDTMINRLAKGDSRSAIKELLMGAREYGTPLTKAPEGYRAVKGVPELADLAFPEAEARHFERTRKVYNNMPEHLTAFLKIHDKTMRWWRAWTLAPFPVYHVRNVIGNMWNNYLAGVGINDNLEAVKVRTMLARGARYKGGKGWDHVVSVHPVSKEKITARDMFLAGEKRNLWNTGMITVENPEQSLLKYADKVEARVRRQVKGKKVNLGELIQQEIMPSNSALAAMTNIFGAEHPFIQTGFKVAGYLEDQAKLAHIINRVKGGMSLDDAISSAKKYLFDYQKMTGFERNALRRVFPFYMWSRNNIPLQLEFLVKRPYRALNYNRAVRSEQSVAGLYGKPEAALLSEWMRKIGAVRYRKGSDGRYYYLAATGWLPLHDLVEAFDVMNLVKGNLSPIPRAAYEYLLNIDTMTNRKIDLLCDSHWPGKWIKHGERRKLLGVELPRHAQHFLRANIRAMRMADDLTSNPQNLDLMARVLRPFVGRDYPYDVDRSRASFFKILRDVQSRHRKAYYSKIFYGEPKGAQRVEKEYLKRLQGLYKEWTGA